MQESRDIGRQSLVRRGIATENGLGSEHLNQATQATHKGHPAHPVGSGIPREKIIGVGLGMAGLIDAEHGCCIDSWMIN